MPCTCVTKSGMKEYGQNEQLRRRIPTNDVIVALMNCHIRYHARAPLMASALSQWHRVIQEKT